MFIPLSSSGERISLNCFDGLIVDMDFAHSTDVLLGVIDEKASFYVFKITTSGLNQLQYSFCCKFSHKFCANFRKCTVQCASNLFKKLKTQYFITHSCP